MTLTEFTNNWADFKTMVEATLARQDDTLDKREGSVLYDFAALTDNNIVSFAISIGDLFNQLFLNLYLKNIHILLTRYKACAILNVSSQDT